MCGSAADQRRENSTAEETQRQGEIRHDSSTCLKVCCQSTQQICPPPPPIRLTSCMLHHDFLLVEHILYTILFKVLQNTFTRFKKRKSNIRMQITPFLQMKRFRTDRRTGREDEMNYSETSSSTLNSDCHSCRGESCLRSGWTTEG